MVVGVCYVRLYVCVLCIAPACVCASVCVVCVSWWPRYCCLVLPLCSCVLGCDCFGLTCCCVRLLGFCDSVCFFCTIFLSPLSRAVQVFIVVDFVLGLLQKQRILQRIW